MEHLLCTRYRVPVTAAAGFLICGTCISWGPVGEAGVTADLHTYSGHASSAATLLTPLGFMEAEEGLLLPPSLRLLRVLSRLCHSSPSVTGGQSLSCLETTQELSFGSGSHGPLWVWQGCVLTGSSRGESHFIAHSGAENSVWV